MENNEQELSMESIKLLKNTTYKNKPVATVIFSNITDPFDNNEIVKMKIYIDENNDEYDLKIKGSLISDNGIPQSWSNGQWETSTYNTTYPIDIDKVNEICNAVNSKDEQSLYKILCSYDNNFTDDFESYFKTGTDYYKQQPSRDIIFENKKIQEGTDIKITDLQKNKESELNPQDIKSAGVSSENTKITDKNSFDNFKKVYKNLIDMKFKQDYPALEKDDKLWEDIAKELYLQSKNYLGDIQTDAVAEEKKLQESDNKEITNSIYYDLDSLVELGLQKISELTNMKCKLEKIEDTNNAFITVTGDMDAYKKFVDMSQGKF